MMQYPEVWEKIHAKLAEHGFILRYLDGYGHAAYDTAPDYKKRMLRFLVA